MASSIAGLERGTRGLELKLLQLMERIIELERISGEPTQLVLDVGDRRFVVGDYTKRNGIYIW